MIKEETLDIKGTIKGFVSEDKPEKTQEQEILEFKEKKKVAKMRNLTLEEAKKVKGREEEEEERLKRIKQELIQSLRVRIPEIEKKFSMMLDEGKNNKFSEKENIKIKENGGRQAQKETKKEDYVQEEEKGEREQ